ncbi:MAG: uroporphyrinogen decarboxylase [Deltaproteobacteria bacterium]|nr:uroporphyrinogen decarboxylase [Deltaproteobacteria bacterium]
MEPKLNQQPTDLTCRQRFVATLDGRPVDRPPVWLMRQAGRYMAEYRAIREKHSFLQMVHTPDLAAEVTLQPVRRLGVDAAILFSDILTIPEAMGIRVAFPEGGPQLEPVVTTAAAVHALAPCTAIDRLAYVGEAVRAVRREIGDTHALIGFSGAPFTLACYMVEGRGSKSYDGVKALMYTEPALFGRLLDKLADWVIAYLQMQLDAGADAVQMFDSWAGELRCEDYRRHVLPTTLRIARAIADRGGRFMLFARNPGHLQDAIADVPAAAVGLDQRADLGRAAQAAKAAGRAVQGNLDPIELFAPPEVIAARVAEMYAQVDGCAWVANLGHGITPRTPMAGVEAFVHAVQHLPPRSA